MLTELILTLLVPLVPSTVHTGSPIMFKLKLPSPLLVHGRFVVVLVRSMSADAGVRVSGAKAGPLAHVTTAAGMGSPKLRVMLEGELRLW